MNYHTFWLNYEIYYDEKYKDLTVVFAIVNLNGLVLNAVYHVAETGMLHCP